MTNSEFKAWFDGFTEAMDDIPSKRQWDRVKEQVKNIDGVDVMGKLTPITRYYGERYWPGGPYWGIGVSGPMYAYAYGANYCAAQGMVGNNQAEAVQSFNSQSAMYALGQLEASSADE